MRKRKESSVKFVAPEIVPDKVMLAERKLANTCRCCGQGEVIEDLYYINEHPIKDHHPMCFWRLHYHKESDYILEKAYTKPTTCAVFRRKGKAAGPHHIAAYIDDEAAQRFKYYSSEIP